MGRIILVLFLTSMLSGCFWDKKLVKPVCADREVSANYNIILPKRPILTVNKLGPEATNGQAVRAYETDLLNVIEYTIQLENILKPIANDQYDQTHEIKIKN